MESERVEVVSYKVVFTEAEAEWLRGLMQNPISNDPNPENEDSLDRAMRLRLWKALTA
jgi:hypothetical protein